MKKLFESGNWKIGRNIKNVGKYEGELKKFKLHGLTKLFEEDGSIVYGDFKDNIRDGLSFSIFSN